MARVSVLLEENLKGDVDILSSLINDSVTDILGKAVGEFIDRQDPKIKTAIEAARKARK